MLFILEVSFKVGAPTLKLLSSSESICDTNLAHEVEEHDKFHQAVYKVGGGEISSDLLVISEHPG